MKPKRLGAILVGLTGLLLLAVALSFLRFKEPTYEGKTVSVWFKEHAYATNTAPTPLQTVTTRILPDGRVMLRLVTPAGRPGSLPGPTNRAGLSTLLQWQTSPQYEPAWEALQALGSNAVPCLVRHIRVGAWDRTYERAITNLPAFIQRRLPNPNEKRWYRFRALETLARLKDSARGATPALLELLHKREPLLRSRVLTTLRSIYADSYSISGLLLQLGEQQRYAEVLEIARATKWEGREVARLFGQILQSSDATLHRDAITLLEAAGENAAPALEAILAALHSQDWEVRYLAARAVENINGKTPPEAQSRIAAAMQLCLADRQEMVSNVAHRIILKANPDATHLRSAIPPFPAAGQTNRQASQSR